MHIHLPAGATPKDGPSAGITLATTIVSLLTNTPVSKDVAMTGEITLTGKVLPIGGLKEKALAAMRMNIKTIIIPWKNRKDLEEIPEEYRAKLTFIPVKNFDEVLDIALVGWKEKKALLRKKVYRAKETLPPAAA
jgi:ATP-dependent Lon protease